MCGILHLTVSIIRYVEKEYGFKVCYPDVVIYSLVESPNIPLMTQGLPQQLHCKDQGTAGTKQGKFYLRCTHVSIYSSSHSTQVPTAASTDHNLELIETSDTRCHYKLLITGNAGYSLPSAV